MSVLKNTKSLEEFVIILREYEIKTSAKFVCTQSDKAFSEIEFMPNENMRVLWKGDMPHFYIGRRVYACHQGKDTNLFQKKRYAEKRDSKDHDFTARRKLAQPTKKLDCPVKINVSRMLALPSFKVNKLTKREKFKMGVAIKEKIKKGEDILGENLYSFNLPDPTSHENHIVGLTAAVTETVDSRVRSKIKELVSEGKRNISKITALLEQYVVNELGETDKLRSRFYLQKESVRNIVETVKSEMQWTKIDKKNAKKLAKSWEENVVNIQKNSTSNIPHKSTDEDVSNDLFCPAQEYGKLGLRKSEKNKLISECNSTIRSLQSAMWLMEKEHLKKLKSELQFLYKKATLNVTVDKDTALPIVTPSTEAKALYQYAELPMPVKKKVKRCGKSADAKENCMDLLNSIIDETTIRNISVSIEDFSPTLEVATSISISPEKKKFKPYGSKIPASLIEDQCKPGVKLDDTVINYAQKIIYSQEKQKAGFQDTILGQCLKFKKQRSGIQILHNGVDHWVTIRIVDHCNIELYDSMGLPPTKSLQNQIAMIVQNTESGTILIHRKAVQKQEINDCGVLAIAFALSLARKKNPEDLTYCARSLRGHLRACLMSGVFTDFKETSDTVDRVKVSTFTITI